MDLNTLKKEKLVPKKGVIFDLDGTLINSLEDLTDACNAVMASYGLPAKTYEEGKKLIGHGLRNLITRALPESMREDNIITQAHQRMLREYALRYTAKTCPYPHIPETLTYLKTKGIPYAVNTNKPKEPAELIVQSLFCREDFFTVTGDSPDHPRKPDPTMALTIARDMGITPETCVYCGDSVVDYETAMNAGMLPLICTWGFTDAQILRPLPEAVILEDPKELIPVLGCLCHFES